MIIEDMGTSDRGWMRNIVGTFLTILLIATEAWAGPSRVAIMADAAAHSAGIDDAFATALGSNSSISLVERARLSAIVNEQAFQTLMSTRADRTRVGQLVAADLLALLTLRQNTVELIVADSRLGVTLSRTSVTAPTNRREQTAKQLSEDLLSTVARFDAGVKYVAAVPDFVSRDLGLDRTFLQFDYAEVIRESYRSTPGVAVVAVDEAQAIAAERDIAGTTQQQRLVPLFVEGEYRTDRDTSGRRSVRITVRARDASHTLIEKASDPMSLDQAGKYLVELFARELAPITTQDRAPIDLSRQFDLLSRRADAFSQIGEFRRAAALREAALLIKPDADEQRVQLIREYTRHNQRPVESSQFPKGTQQTDTDPFWKAVVYSVINDWNRALNHCEYLIRNRRLSREEATQLTYPAMKSITGVRATTADMLKDCETVKKQYLREVFSQIGSLDPAPADRRGGLTGMLDAYHAIAELSLFRCDGNFLTADDLDLITDLLEHRLPETLQLTARYAYFLNDAPLREGDGDERFQYTEQAYLDFLKGLSQSKRRVVRIYGRYGMLVFRRSVKHEATTELAKEAESIASELRAVRAEDPEQFVYLSEAQRAFAVSTTPPNPRVTAAPTTRPRVATQPARRGGGQTSANTTVRVKLEPIALALDSKLRTEKSLTRGVRWRAPGGWGGITRFRPLGKGIDALWTGGALLLLREAGIAQEVLADEGLNIQDVVADEQHIWVAASYSRGIYVLDRTGKEQLRIDAKDGLPPTEITGPLLYSISPGRILAAGSFGSEHRGWIAIISVRDNTAKVDVIHEATKVWNYNDGNNPNNLDPTMCFEPETIFEYSDAAPNSPRQIYISRRYNPLVVDLTTQKVSVYPIQNWYQDAFPRNEGPSEAFMCIDGVLWIAGSDRDFRSYIRNAETGLFQVSRERANWHLGNYTHGTLTRVGDWLYYAGSNWRRMNLKTGAEEVLLDNARQLPNYGSGDAWTLAHSSRYGLVAFCGGTLYRVMIDGAAIP